MESIFAFIIVLFVAAAVFFVAKSGLPFMQMAMIILVVAVVGIIGGAVLVAVIKSSPLLGITAAVIAGIVIYAVVRGMIEAFTEKGKLEKGARTTETVSDKGEDEILKKLGDLKEGDSVEFGRHRWTVLENDGQNALLITQNAVTARPFSDQSSTPWENSSLRQYLNGKFFESNFGEGEKKLILEKNIDNLSLKYGSTPQKELPRTADRIFIPSKREAEKYKQYMPCENLGDTRRFWLRTTVGAYACVAECLSGRTSTGGLTYWNDQFLDGAVRPMMWIRTK